MIMLPTNEIIYQITRRMNRSNIPKIFTPFEAINEFYSMNYQKIIALPRRSTRWKNENNKKAKKRQSQSEKKVNGKQGKMKKFRREASRRVEIEVEKWFWTSTTIFQEVTASIVSPSFCRSYSTLFFFPLCWLLAARKNYFENFIAVVLSFKVSLSSSSVR